MGATRWAFTSVQGAEGRERDQGDLTPGPCDPKCGGADLDLSEAYASALRAPGIRARLIAWRKTVREQ